MGTYLEEHPNKNQRQFKARTEPVSGLIVVHTAESPADVKGPDAGAENVAKFISTRSTPGSYHVLGDSDSRIRLVPFDQQAYGDGTGSNPFAIHISLACSAHQWATMPAKWRNDAIDRLAQAAFSAAKYVWEERKIMIPIRRITKAESDARKPGFIAHGDRDPGRRTDPGPDFPWKLFFQRFTYYYAPWVARQMNGGKKPAVVPTKKATPAPAKKTTPAAKKSVPEVAKEVLAGRWGNGDDRVRRLRGAGYNVQAVQSEVTRLNKLNQKKD